MEGREVELKDYMMVISKRKWAFIITFAICFSLSIIITFFEKPAYHAEASFQIGIVPAGIIIDQASMTKFCQSDYLMNKIINVLSLSPRENLKVGVNYTNSTMTISLDSSNPEEAVKILNTAMDVIVKEHAILFEEKMKPLRKEINGLREQIGLLEYNKDNISRLFYFNLKNQLIQIEENISSSKNTEIILPATASKKPVSPRPDVNIPMGIIVGIFVGIFFVFLQEYISKEKQG